MNTKKLKDHPIILAMSIFTIAFGSFWALYRPVLAENLSVYFETKAESKAHALANDERFKADDERYENDKKQYARNNIAKAIQATQDTQSIISVIVSFHEENALTKATETSLSNRLTRQQGVEKCMMRGGDNCVAENP